MREGRAVRLTGRVAREAHRAVLRQFDQRQGRAPTVCVKTGVPTDGATRARAVALPHGDLWESVAGSVLTRLVALVTGRRSPPVVLAVSPAAWKRWRGRLAVAILVTAIGLGLLVVGLVRPDAGMVILGAVFTAAGWWLRWRSWRAWWVGLHWHRGPDEVIVTRVHPAFADQARAIYVDSIRRHPAPR
jgi:hypothetical protein